MTGTKPNSHLVNLGIAISGATLLPGEVRTCHDIKCFIDATFEVMTNTHRTISHQRIQQIGEKALRKLRHPSQISKLR